MVNYWLINIYAALLCEYAVDGKPVILHLKFSGADFVWDIVEQVSFMF